jgi:hypothetical protein
MPFHAFCVPKREYSVGKFSVGIDPPLLVPQGVEFLSTRKPAYLRGPSHLVDCGPFRQTAVRKMSILAERSRPEPVEKPQIAADSSGYQLFEQLLFIQSNG